MRIGRKQRQNRETDIDITPLMDVIFLLLIFFMVATSFREQTRALDVNLPRAENPSIITLDENVLTITIDENKLIYLDKELIENENLKKELDKRIRETGYRRAIIKADASTPYHIVVAVVDALNAVETEGISFAVRYRTM